MPHFIFDKPGQHGIKKQHHLAVKVTLEDSEKGCHVLSPAESESSLDVTFLLSAHWHVRPIRYNSFPAALKQP